MAIQGSFFSNTIDDTTRKILRNRAKAYKSGSAGGSAALTWLNNRRAGVEVIVKSLTGETLTLSTYRRGGLAGQYTTGGDASGVYKPRPVLNNVTIDTAGELGSLQKGKIDFTVFTKAQLDEYSIFFQLSNTITITGTWYGASSEYTDTFSFEGIIHNFSFSLTQQGGFNCVVDFTGPGISVLGAKTGIGFYVPNAVVPSIFKDRAGVLDGTYVTLPLLLETLKNFHLSAAETGTTPTSISTVFNADLIVNPGSIIFYAPQYADYKTQFSDTKGIKWQEYSSSFNTTTIGYRCGDNNGVVGPTIFSAGAYGVLTPSSTERPVSPAANVSKFVDGDNNLLNGGRITYITLSAFISLVEAMIKKVGGKQFDQIKLNGAVIPTAEVPTGLTSLNWSELLIPGTVSWYSVSDAEGGQTQNIPFDIQSASDLDTGFTVDDSGGCRMLIGIDWLINEYTSFASRRESTDTKVNDYLIKFINQTFDMIARNTCNFYKFTMVQNPDNKNEWIVVNNNYVPPPTDFLYEIPVQTNGGVATAVQLTGKLPTDLQTAAFINNRSGNTLTGLGPPNVDQIKAGGHEAGAATSITPPSDTELRQIMSQYWKVGLTTEVIEQAKGVLDRLVNFKLGVTNSNNSSPAATVYAQLVPLELSLTFEGIGGLKYGNAFTINYIPNSLTPNNGVYFTITKVTQKFSNDGTWATDISTIMRIADRYFTPKSI